MTDITVADLTLTTLNGTGVFDTLMRANKTHLEQEFSLGRIKGTEYATVYLGSLEGVMRTSLEFLLQKQKISLEAQLMEQQILLAQVEVIKANAAVDLVRAQILNTQAELAIIQANATKIPAEIAQLQAQTALVGQQKINLIAEGSNIPKQGLLLDAEVINKQKQTAVIDEEILIKKQQVQVSIAEVGIAQAKLVNIPKEGLQLDAQTALTGQQKVNLADDILTNVKQRDKLTQEVTNMGIQGTLLTQQKINLTSEELNIPKQGLVLDAQNCKLKAEFDVLQIEKLKVASENSLLTQKVSTEKAQTTAVGVDTDSVVGRQKGLYLAQSDGFKRDAEQKAAKLLIDTWNVRRTTTGATELADSSNGLLNSNIKVAVDKLLSGIA